MSKNRHPNLSRAREMRNNPTEAERKLWYQLRANQLAGIKFRRQATIGNYIADFVTYDHMLIIEVDGDQHSEQREYDEKRTRWLESQGFRVIRFWNHEVFESLDGVLRSLARELGLPD